eukprot:CAMPEP_0170568434 /NCGR_PEP_ID=MMETSP0211-20121228/81198_1 /TAXON_ID=311385 /ORGANISM="Pseudokeronopsis sp., Strain OXSARD2" /LENGTH=139 /DNA_ID=CAMNT_0010890327 /DNA_START=271 /DNA_END=686 /DNA_ORIENTATION=-
MIELLILKDEYHNIPNREVVVDREYLEAAYKKIGYICIPLNVEGARSHIKHGAYILEVARPPISIEAYDKALKLPAKIKFTVVKPQTGVNKTRLVDIKQHQIENLQSGYMKKSNKQLNVERKLNMEQVEDSRGFLQRGP